MHIRTCFHRVDNGIRNKEERTVTYKRFILPTTLRRKLMNKLFKLVSVSIIAVVIVIAATLITTVSTPASTYAQQPCPCVPAGPPLPTPISGRAILKCDTVCGCQTAPTPTPVPTAAVFQGSCCLYIADCACGGSAPAKKVTKPVFWANSSVGATCVPLTKNLKENWKD